MAQYVNPYNTQNFTGYDPYPPYAQGTPQAYPSNWVYTATPAKTLSARYITSDDEVINYPIGRNCDVIFIDFNRRVFYLKSSDVNGVLYPLRRFPFNEETPTPDKGGDYATKSDFDELSRKLNDLIEKLGGDK